jgi:putative Holliday junction resolvase
MNIVALDIGLKRVGLALSRDKSIVTPLQAVQRKNRDQASREVSSELKRWEAEKIVVGLPLGDSRDEMYRRFSHFVSLLDFNGEVVYVDEDLSSFEAKESIKGVIKQKRDGRIDSLSAKIILERYLSQQN